MIARWLGLDDPVMDCGLHRPLVMTPPERRQSTKTAPAVRALAETIRRDQPTSKTELIKALMARPEIAEATFRRNDKGSYSLFITPVNGAEILMTRFSEAFEPRKLEALFRHTRSLNRARDWLNGRKLDQVLAPITADLDEILEEFEDVWKTFPETLAAADGRPGLPDKGGVEGVGDRVGQHGNVEASFGEAAATARPPRTRGDGGYAASRETAGNPSVADEDDKGDDVRIDFGWKGPEIDGRRDISIESASHIAAGSDRTARAGNRNADPDDGGVIGGNQVDAPGTARGPVLVSRNRGLTAVFRAALSVCSSLAIRPKLTIDAARTAIRIAARRLGTVIATTNDVTVVSAPEGDDSILRSFCRRLAGMLDMDFDVRSLPWNRGRPPGPGDVLFCRKDGGRLPRKAVGNTVFVVPEQGESQTLQCANLLRSDYGLQLPPHAFQYIDSLSKELSSATVVLVVTNGIKSAMEADPTIWAERLSELLTKAPNALFIAEGGRIASALALHKWVVARIRAESDARPDGEDDLRP